MNYRNQKGMTYVEVLVSMVIISIALIPMFYMFDFGTKLTFFASDETEALNFAQTKIEQAKHAVGALKNPATAGKVKSKEGYDYKVLISGEKLKNIKVTVYYDNKQVELMTRIKVNSENEE